MPMICPRYAPFMCFLWAWYVTFHGYGVGMALLAFRELSMGEVIQTGYRVMVQRGIVTSRDTKKMQLPCLFV